MTAPGKVLGTACLSQPAWHGLACLSQAAVGEWGLRGMVVVAVLPSECVNLSTVG